MNDVNFSCVCVYTFEQGPHTLPPPHTRHIYQKRGAAKDISLKEQGLLLHRGIPVKECQQRESGVQDSSIEWAVLVNLSS